MVKCDEVIKDPRVKAYLTEGNKILKTLGFTEHGEVYAGITSRTAGSILKALQFTDEAIEMAKLVG